MDPDRPNNRSTQEDSENSTDPKEFVRENRQEIVAIIRSSSDPFMRAYAWALLDEYTPDPDTAELYEELDAITEQEERR